MCSFKAELERAVNPVKPKVYCFTRRPFPPCRKQVCVLVIAIVGTVTKIGSVTFSALVI